jgi:phosphate starvation-inducible PhoH-like protein
MAIFLLAYRWQEKRYRYFLCILDNNMLFSSILVLSYTTSRVFAYRHFGSFRAGGGGLLMKKCSNAGTAAGISPNHFTTTARCISPQYKPKTKNQEKYVEYLNDAKCPIVFGTGPAGCGKTLFACVTAIQQLAAGDVKKIVLTRPVVSVENEELGFLPGSLVHKMDPWTRPIFDIFLEYYQQRDIDLMLRTGVIEVSPLAYMRGRTFKRCFIIADEMQNSTPNQMMMLTTRIGDLSKLVITGDLRQTDRPELNGLSDIVRRVHRRAGSLIKVAEMNETDVLRSPVVLEILNLYNDNIAGCGGGGCGGAGCGCGGGGCGGCSLEI